MDKFQAAFEILFILCAVDGHVDQREIKVVSQFLQENIKAINFNPEAVIKNIYKLNGDGVIEELNHAAMVFKANASVQDRITILNFAVELLSADGKISDEEMYFLNFLGELWNIDMKAFIEDL